MLADRREDVVETARGGKAHNVRVFGSVASGDDTDDSDIDLLIDLEPGVGPFALTELELELKSQRFPSGQLSWVRLHGSTDAARVPFLEARRGASGKTKEYPSGWSS